mmetsp:Transcript_29314/g.86859  ORF Transcript_29314/g.86859 Transcript_29314/m.86859 type:complete len:119 (-) Transcript_29314:4119-4475(-)
MEDARGEVQPWRCGDAFFAVPLYLQLGGMVTVGVLFVLEALRNSGDDDVSVGGDISKTEGGEEAHVGEEANRGGGNPISLATGSSQQQGGRCSKCFIEMPSGYGDHDTEKTQEAIHNQ